MKTADPLPADALEVLDRAVAGLGGDDRPGQHRLATGVAEAIADGHHLLAEAPTGSGKSLAYLAPIVAAGVRAVVATATLTLQDQLWRNDLPLLREHSGRRVSSALLKGRSNYLCLARLDGADTSDALFDERPGPTFSEDLVALQSFAESTDTGDVADLDDAIAPSSWRAVTCGPNECPGATRCAHGVDCFAERARFRAESVDIVVVNHALYAAHLAAGGRVLPPHDVLVVDEAHAFDRIATSALGADVTAAGLRQLAGRLRRAGARADLADALNDSAARFAGALGDLEGRVDPTEAELAVALASAAERVALASGGVNATESALAAQAVKLASSRLDALRRLQTPADGEVAWVEGGDRATLRLAPVSIGSRLAPLLFATVPVVMVSATLGPGERFEPLARRLGLDPALSPSDPGAKPRGRRDEDEVDTDDEADDGLNNGQNDEPNRGLGYEALHIESPFSLREQGMLYVAKHLPDVREAGWAKAAADELCDLVDAAGGRTLVLCTSWRGVRTFSEVLSERTEHRVLTQGDDTTARLIEEFGDDETSCLVATRAFWQGLDVPGPACVLVVIDRLPFARPDDPLEQARREAVERSGGDGFREIDLPAAALVLAQGTGRLIRSHDDRGVVAVLDRRLATAGYRSVLLASMPPLRRVVDPAEARAFLGAAAG
ncbi:MAG: ATP-dependent DNA helicase [Acidimicrobiia bacterium]|nr:ATP-dependent DNA helicase [Acidimicrobiia bacterium]